MFKSGILFRSSALDRMTNKDDVNVVIKSLGIQVLIGKLFLCAHRLYRSIEIDTIFFISFLFLYFLIFLFLYFLISF